MLELLLKTKLEDYIIISMGVASFYNALMISEPYQWFLRKIDSHGTLPRWREITIQLLSCPMCVSFWTVLLLTFNPLMAGMAFVAAKIIDNYFYGR